LHAPDYRGALANELQAFKIAGLVPGGIGFAQMKLLTPALLKRGWPKTYIAATAG